MIIRINGRIKENESPMEEPTEFDEIAGGKIAEVIGDATVECHSLTPTQQWSRIVSLLRHHGVAVSIRAE